MNNAVVNETVGNKMPPNKRFQPTASLACARFAAAEARAVSLLFVGANPNTAWTEDSKISGELFR